MTTTDISNISEEEFLNQLADALTDLGTEAIAQDTGGGMVCIVMPHKDGGEISWGTADVNWGAVITDEDGEFVSSIETSWPSESRDLAGTAAALLEPSKKNGAVLSEG
jgi:hypothetical protein